MGSRKHILPTKEEQARLKFQKFRKQYMQKGSTLPRLNLSNINNFYKKTFYSKKFSNDFNFTILQGKKAH